MPTSCRRWLSLLLGGGTAWAAQSLASNSVFSRHIKNGEVKGPDLASNAVTSPKVRNGSLREVDLAPGVLPVGGFIGGVEAACTQDATAPGESAEGFATCGAAFGDVVLKRRARLHLLATGGWIVWGGAAEGQCRLTVDGSVVAATVEMGEVVDTTGGGAKNSFAVQAVTNPLSKGAHAVALECRESVGDMDWSDVVLTFTTFAA